jgi:hypothetical protein
MHDSFERVECLQLACEKGPAKRTVLRLSINVLATFSIDTH